MIWMKIGLHFRFLEHLIPPAWQRWEQHWHGHSGLWTYLGKPQKSAMLFCWSPAQTKKTVKPREHLPRQTSRNHVPSPKKIKKTRKHQHAEILVSFTKRFQTRRRCFTCHVAQGPSRRASQLLHFQQFQQSRQRQTELGAQRWAARQVQDAPQRGTLRLGARQSEAAGDEGRQFTSTADGLGGWGGDFGSLTKWCQIICEVPIKMGITSLCLGMENIFEPTKILSALNWELGVVWCCWGELKGLGLVWICDGFGYLMNQYLWKWKKQSYSLA